MKAKRNTALENIARAARLRPSRAPVTHAEYCYVRKHASTFAVVAAECAALLPLLNAYLKDQAEPGRVIRDNMVLLCMKNNILGNGMIRPAAWRYVCNNGCGVFEPVWRMSADKDTWPAAKLYLEALDRANLPPPPPRVLALGWLRMFAIPGADLFRMDQSLMCIPTSITRCVLLEADRHRNGLTEAKVGELLRALSWGENVRQPPVKAQRRAGWAWVNRMAAQWEAEMDIRVDEPDRGWGVRIDSFSAHGYTVKALRTPRDLIRHAEMMRNCLETKVQDCRDGLARFYAVWPPGKTRRPLAHIGLVFDESAQRWRVTDCKGFANAPATDDACQIARELERRFNPAPAQCSVAEPAPLPYLFCSAA